MLGSLLNSHLLGSLLDPDPLGSLLDRDLLGSLLDPDPLGSLLDRDLLGNLLVCNNTRAFFCAYTFQVTSTVGMMNVHQPQRCFMLHTRLPSFASWISSSDPWQACLPAVTRTIGSETQEFCEAGQEKMNSSSDNHRSLTFARAHSPRTLEQVPAQRAGRVVGGGEPLVETGRVELLLAGPAGQLGQLVVGAVQDVVTDVALLKNRV